MSSDSVEVPRPVSVCTSCGDEVESHSLHDYRSCSCGNVLMAGSTTYLRWPRAWEKEEKR